MIKIEHAEVVGWDHAIRGMRNPLNSWELSDSYYECYSGPCDECELDACAYWGKGYILGKEDARLATTLRNAGTDHRKYMRMIDVYLDITAPLYWWKEFDTYKVGTVANSCSTMHKIHAKEFTLEDFSYEHLDEASITLLEDIINHLNDMRAWFNELTSNDAAKKEKWWQMIQLLPSSYNQKRTIKLNYEVLANMYHSRKNHKLDEWREFCKWIESLPYSELITGKREPKEYDTESYPDADRLVGKIDKKLDELKNKEESNE